jgi:hypothetical protein
MQPYGLAKIINGGIVYLRINFIFYWFFLKPRGRALMQVDNRKIVRSILLSWHS